MTKESKRGMKIPDLFCQPLSLILLISSSLNFLFFIFQELLLTWFTSLRCSEAHIPRRWFLVPLKTDPWTQFLWDQRRQESDFWSWSTSKIIMRREKKRDRSQETRHDTEKKRTSCCWRKKDRWYDLRKERQSFKKRREMVYRPITTNTVKRNHHKRREGREKMMRVKGGRISFRTCACLAAGFSCCCLWFTSPASSFFQRECLCFYIFWSCLLENSLLRQPLLSTYTSVSPEYRS